jgi:ribonuclease HII
MGVIMEVNKRHKEIIAKNLKFLIGIDEAGRGALAGPVAVGVVGWRVADWPACAGRPKIKKFLQDYPVGKDSKKLTPKERDFWFGKIEELKKQKLVSFAVAFSSNKIIDKKGINFAIKRGIEKNLQRLGGETSKSLILLDGGLKAPANWPNQQTIIKGDEKELIIGLASIVAKVSRDRLMVKLSKKYPQHGLHQHKGYGTKLHYQKITQFGVLVIHRQTYLPK